MTREAQALLLVLVTGIAALAVVVLLARPGCEDVILATSGSPTPDVLRCPEPTFLVQYALHPSGAAHAVCRCPAGILDPEG